MTVDEALKKEKTRLLLYRTVFNTEDGQKVVKDLMDRFLWQDASPHVLARNNMSVSYVVGQQMLMRALNRWLTEDIDTYLERYRQPVELAQGDPLDGGQSTEPSAGYH